MKRALKKILPYLTLFPSLLVAGSIFGGFVASRLLDRPADGWTQISQALGGFMLGGLGGLVLAVVLLLTLPPSRLLWVSGSAALAALIFVFVLRATHPGRASQSSQSLPSAVDRPTLDRTEPRPVTPSADTRSETKPTASAAPAPMPQLDGEPSSPEPPKTESGVIGREPALAASRLPCEASPDRDAARFSAEVEGGEVFRRAFGRGWEFVLEPFSTDATVPGAGGFRIGVLSPEAQGARRDLARLTPPLRGPSPLHVVAWHFLNQDGTGPNEGSVNAPQRLRLFFFSPEVGRTIGQRGSPTAEDIERVSAFGRGALEILDLELSRPATVGRLATAGIDRLRFAACLTWKREEPSLDRASED